MAGNTLGETIYTDARYIKHPAGSGATHLDDGAPLDAGTIQIVDSNLSTLARCNARHLVWDPGFGTGGLVLNDGGRGYDGDDDVGIPPTADFTGAERYSLISWDARTARHYGPIFAVDDALLAGGVPGYGPRTVRVDVDCVSTTGTSLTLLAALTAGFTYPSDDRLAFASNVPAAGRSVVTLTLTPAGVDEYRAGRRCRASGTGTTIYSTPLEVYLWVGWCRTQAGDGVIAISAAELGGDR